MSLTSCLKNAGSALSSEDRQQIMSRVAQVKREEGVSQDEAARRVVDEMLAQAEADLRAAEQAMRSAPSQAQRQVVEPVDQDRREMPRSQMLLFDRDAQWASGQTATPEFRRWFADSKAVDEKGRPMVLYHGTTRDVAEFAPSASGTMGPGIYLAPRPGMANTYAGSAEGSNVLPVFARLSNPIVVTRGPGRLAVAEQLRAAIGADLQIGPGRDGTPSLRDPEFIAKAQAAGFDGVILRSATGIGELTVFDPAQVKSATGNRGTFDPNDPSIVNEEGGGYEGGLARRREAGLGLGGQSLDSLAITENETVPGRGSQRPASPSGDAPEAEGSVSQGGAPYDAAGSGRVFQGFAQLGREPADATWALRRASDLAGVPVPQAALVDRLPPNVRSRVDTSTGTIEYDAQTQALPRGEFVQILLEEVMHTVDLVGVRRSLSASSPRLARNGDIRLEAQQAFDSGRGMADWLAYPLAPGYGFSDQRIAAELLARLVVAYHGDQALLQRSLPTAYEAIHAVFQRVETGPGVAVRPAVPGAGVQRGGSRAVPDAADAGARGSQGAGGPARAASGARDAAGRGRAGDPIGRADRRLRSPDAAAAAASQPSRVEALRAALADVLLADPAGARIDEAGLAAPRAPTIATQPPARTGAPQRRFRLPDFGKAAQTIELLQNRYNRWKQTLEAVRQQGGTITEANDWYRTEERMHGQMAAQAEDFRAELQRLIDAMAADDLGLEQLQEFAYAMHARERNDALRAKRQANPNTGFDSWSGMTDQEAARIIAEARANGTYAALAKHQRTLQDWVQGTRDLMLAEGLITPAEYQVLTTTYLNYVPLRGKPDDPKADPGQAGPDKPRGSGKGFNVRGDETKAAKGRYSMADKIVENIVADRMRVIQRGGKNRVLRSFLQFVEDNPSPNLWEVDAVQTKAVFETDDNGDQVITERASLDKGEDTVAVKDGGMTVYIKIRDRKLREQMQAMNVEQMNGFIGHLTAGNRILGRLYTSLNPVFTVINGARDLQAAAIGMVDEQGFAGAGRFALNLPRAVLESARAELFKRPSQAYQLYRATGGKTGFMGFRDLDEMTRDLQRDLSNANRSWFNPVKLGPRVLELIEDVNAVIENATRFATFQAAYRDGKGESLARSASIAKNITVNFNRKGTQTAASAWFLFFNPAVQGTARIAQALRSPKVLAVLGTAMTGSAMLALANANMGEDDDGRSWWDKIPDEVKDRNLVIVLPPGVTAGEEVPGSKTGRYIKIPLAYGWNFFHTIANQAVDVWRNKQDPARGRGMSEASVEIAKSALKGYLPMGQIGTGLTDNEAGFVMAAVPDVLDPLLQPLVNMSPFGRPLYPTGGFGEAGMPDSQRYFAGQAGTIFQRSAEWLNDKTGGNKYQPGWVDMTPATIEGLVRGYGGGPATFSLDLLNAWYARQTIRRDDLDVRRLPFVKQTYGVIDNETDRAGVYEDMRKVQKVIDPLERARQDAIAGSKEAREFMDKMIDEGGALIELAKVKKGVDEELSEIRKKELQIMSNNTLSEAEKYKALQEFAGGRRQQLQKFTEALNNAVRREAGIDVENPPADPATRIPLAASLARTQTEVARRLGF